MEGKTVQTNRLKFIESKKKIRLSENPLLISAANKNDLIIIGFDDKIIGIPKHEVFDFDENKNQINNIQTNQIKFNYQLSFKPTILTVANHGFSPILLVTGSNISRIPIIEVYDLEAECSIGKLELQDLTGAGIVDYAWHPNYMESLVAFCTNRGHLLVVGLDRALKGLVILFKTDRYKALTCCWSPKGKNLAIGLTDGSVIRLEPMIGKNVVTFKEVESSKFIFSHPNMTPKHQVIKLRWINKTFLLSVHAKLDGPGNPETIYSIITVKPSKPYSVWSGICYESQFSSNYDVYIGNLTNSVICATSAASEAAVLGVLGGAEANNNQLSDWNLLMIDEEGSRIELPLDSKNYETYPRGLAISFYKNAPILVFITSDRLICPFKALHSEDILKLPESQPQSKIELEIPRQVSNPGIASQTSLTNTFGSLSAQVPASVFGSAAKLTPAFNMSSLSTATFGSSAFSVSSPVGFSSLANSAILPTSTAASFSNPNQALFSNTAPTNFSSLVSTSLPVQIPATFTNPAATTSSSNLTPSTFTSPSSTTSSSLFSTSSSNSTTTTFTNPTSTTLSSLFPTNLSNPAPATFTNPAPATFTNPTPSSVTNPAQTTLSSLFSTNLSNPAPATFTNPNPTSLSSLFPANLSNPTPATFTNPTPGTFNSTPSSVTNPAQTTLSSLFSTNLSNPAPATFTNPNPTTLSSLFSTNLSNPTPATFTNPTPTTHSSLFQINSSNSASATPSNLTSLVPNTFSNQTSANLTPNNLSNGPVLSSGPSTTSISKSAAAAGPIKNSDLDDIANLRLNSSAKFLVEISEIKKKLDYNEAYMSILDELNHLRQQLDEVYDVHSTHEEALIAIKGDIDALDLAMLETFYLIDYIKGRGKTSSRKRSLDPMTSKKVELIKKKSRDIGLKLDELNDHVDLAWEDFARRNKDRGHIKSVGTIYETLVTNQKIINLLKRKVDTKQECFSLPAISQESVFTVSLNRRDTEHSRFKDFLGSRSVVPVRRPMRLNKLDFTKQK